MVDIGRLHINDKVMHFCAYLALSFLPVIGFQDRCRGIVAGLFGRHARVPANCRTTIHSPGCPQFSAPLIALSLHNGHRYAQMPPFPESTGP
jgi:hypothetical protein